MGCLGELFVSETNWKAIVCFADPISKAPRLHGEIRVKAKPTVSHCDGGRICVSVCVWRLDDIAQSPTAGIKDRREREIGSSTDGGRL